MPSGLHEEATGVEVDEEPNKKSPDLARRDAQGRFVPGSIGNPKGRPAGASCRALRMARQAAEEVALPVLIEAARNGNLDACRVLVGYGLPRQRPVTLPEPVDLPDTGTLSDQIQALLRLVAAGEVSPSAATEISGIIATAARVDEVTELREQVESLKRLLDSRKDKKR